MTTAQSAAEAYERYTAALSADLIIQSDWHREKDGQQLACALGVIGDEVTSPAKCPAAVMPRWLAQMVPWLFDNQNIDDAKDWGARFYAELSRIDGKVPFTVVYDWHANFVCPLGIDAATKRGRKTEPHEELKALHERALAGDRATRDEWFAKLRNAYAYANANANANAYAYAYANAYADAYADADADANADARQGAIKRLADGMVECLSRVPTTDKGETR